MYFINNFHKESFEKYVEKNPNKKNDLEYRSVYYILSVPELFNRTSFHHSAPLEWTRKWNEDDTYVMSDAYLVLSHSEQLLVDLAQNLFNSDNKFNLMDALGVFGEEYRLVMLEAIAIRLNLLPK
jgi:hypothetical protein